MQTFLPYPDFAESAKALDRARLGKQRVEAVQILKALHTGSGWVHHPAVKMWDGYEHALVEYLGAMCDEWIARGYDNTKCSEHLAYWRGRYNGPYDLPPWLGDEEFHASHRRKLAWKLPEHYTPIFGIVVDDEPAYVWPKAAA